MGARVYGSISTYNVFKLAEHVYDLLVVNRMAAAPPSYCFVAFPPCSKDGLVVFGKNSARPRDEVQEVVYFAAATHDPGSKVECTYIEIEQVPKTHAVVLSRPSWLWGAEMGANEHGVCVANEAVVTREPASESEALLGMDLVRLGLERGATAREALDVIVALLEEHGQGGNYYEDGSSCHAFQSAFLIVDRNEAWILETSGKYWAAEKITEGVKCICNQLSLTTKIDAEHPELRNYVRSQGWWNDDTDFNFSEVFSLDDDHLACCSGRESLEKQGGDVSAQTMIDVLRDKDSGVCVDSESFLTTASIVSVLPQDPSFPCVHYFTGTPDPSRSIFKPFIFVDDVKLVPKVQSPSFGDDDPAKKIPRFQEKPDRRHELYKAHEWARSLLENDQDKGQKLMRIMLDLEKQGLEAMEDILTRTEILDPAEVVDLFYDCVDTELKSRLAAKLTCIFLFLLIHTKNGRVEIPVLRGGRTLSPSVQFPPAAQRSGRPHFHHRCSHLRLDLLSSSWSPPPPPAEQGVGWEEEGVTELRACANGTASAGTWGAAAGARHHCWQWR
ncbi:secernin-1 [Aix galericulata]|nr:secernin-1 [Aix galericulata]